MNKPLYLGHKYLFGFIPHFNISKELFGTGREVKFEGKTKNIIHGTQEFQATFDLPFNLSMKRKDPMRSISIHFYNTIFLKLP